jgi:hypothetical protein
MSSGSFLTSDMTSKNEVLMYIFVRNLAAMPPCQTPPSARFYCYNAITDQPRAGEVLLGCGLQSGAVPVSIQVSFQALDIESVGDGGFTIEPAL